MARTTKWVWMAIAFATLATLDARCARRQRLVGAFAISGVADSTVLQADISRAVADHIGTKICSSSCTM